MTTARSIVCGSCGADVPYGRLSCPACGDLLASVAGGTRRASSRDALGAIDGAATFTASAADAASSAGGERVTPGVLHDALAEPGPTTPLEAALTPVDARVWSVASGPAIRPDVGATLAFDDDAEPTFAAPPIVDGTPPPKMPAPAVESPPGAYVPPSAPAAAGTAAFAMPGGAVAPARAWAGYGAGADSGSTAATLDGPAASETSPAASASAARLTEFIGWLAIAGGALAAVGFLLPWGASMIGALGVDFFARWGLAGPFHIVVALAVVVTVVLAIVPNPVPSWIRVGLAGTILGTFMLGLVWPYVFGFAITGPGAHAVGVGALALLAAGIASLVTDRHGRERPPV